MRIERVEAPGAEWDAFVATAPGRSLAHAAAWARALARAYRLSSVYLAARDDAGAIAGVLPLFRFRTLSRRLELVSVPYLDTGGILARDARAERALREAALALARAEGAGALELRQLAPPAAAPAAAVRDRVDMVLPLESGDPEAQWKALPASVRNQTRKATRSGLALAEPGGDLLAEFYAPFAANMRDLGSPVHATAFFRAAADAFGDRLRFVVVRDGARPVGGLVAIHYADAVSVPWASTLRSERRRCPNNLIYWEAIRWAAAEGARELDFGRSPRGAGTYRFKRGWGAVERELAWLRLAPDGRALPADTGADRGFLRQLTRAWARLPVPLASRLGPPIRRHISR